MFKVLHRHWPSLSFSDRPGGRGRALIDPFPALGCSVNGPPVLGEGEGRRTQAAPWAPHCQAVRTMGSWNPCSELLSPSSAPGGCPCRLSALQQPSSARKGKERGEGRRQAHWCLTFGRSWGKKVWLVAWGKYWTINSSEWCLQSWRKKIRCTVLWHTSFCLHSFAYP